MGTDQQIIIPSSFRDPAGFLFLKGGVLYRQINMVGKENYEQFINSGLYEALVGNGYLIKHEETENQGSGAYKTIKPDVVNFISYPYEWCFSQLKNAALLTLEIQKKTLRFGMSLKDASAYNIQFKNGQPILIDTLSFEKYEEGKPWVAYKQFCQHFLAPLALMAYKDIRLGQLSKIYIDGVPLNLASALLPLNTYFKFSLLSHIHLHAKTQDHFSDKQFDIKKYKLNKRGLLTLIDNLESSIHGMKWNPKDTEWADYYDKINYSVEGFEDKKKTITEFLDEIRPDTVWDLGSNNGLFSRLASNKGVFTLSLDIDTSAVEQNYLELLKNKEKNILPLVADLFNPSPAIGWSLRERMSLIERGPADVVLALALVHHLTISNNLSFAAIAKFFRHIGHSLIIEFVPKHDSQVQKLLSTRKDIFANYTQDSFEKEFGEYFSIKQRKKVRDSARCLYLMTGKNG